MITILRPLLFSFVQSKAVKKLIVDMLEALAKRTDNTLDDQAVAIIRDKLL
jgi:hypothetical protein|tara:strand:- start:759 stop:911 length:153 start_codon:yes stop_codon:yes gene_type:complete